MKLKDLTLDVSTLKELQKMIIERVTSIGMIVRKGGDSTNSIMAELVMIEAKMDALMLMLEDKGLVDFADFNNYLKQAATQGRATAVNVRDHFSDKKAGQV